MKKSTFIKRFVALLLVVLMSIDALAAVVGDNDGAAFITKAEFDSMKNNFQTQLERYNSSIDNKIDGAIGSYLAGLNIRKEKQLAPLISNYKDIWWIHQFKLKAKTRKWSDHTTYTGNTSDQWVTWPADKRRNTRENDLIMSGAVGFWALENYYFRFRYEGGAPNLCYGHQMSQTTDPSAVNYANWCVPVNFFRLQDTDKDLLLPEGSEYPNILLAEQSIENAGFFGLIYNSVSVWKNDATKVYWEIEGNAKAIDPSNTDCVTVNEPKTGYFADITVQGHMNNNRTDENKFKARLMMPSSSTIAAYPHVQWNLDNSMHSNITEVYRDWHTQDAGLFTNGVNMIWQGSSNLNKTKQYVVHMLYGADLTTEDRTNVYRLNNYVKQSSQTKPIEEYSDFVSTPWKLTQASFNGYVTTRWTFDNNVVAYVNKEVNLKLPLLENVKIKQIKNPNFKYGNNSSLRLGDGMPLILSCTSNGDVEIEFKYTVNRIIDSLGSNKKISIDLKRANFYDTPNTVTTDFYEGVINGTSKRIKDVEINASDGKVKMEIEGVKEGEDMWIRLAPKCNDGGYYVTISDLKMKLIS